MKLPEVVSSGDRRASLEAIRDRIAEELVAADGRDVAPLAKELRAVIAEIDGMGNERTVSKVDELAARRSPNRKSAAAH